MADFGIAQASTITLAREGRSNTFHPAAKGNNQLLTSIHWGVFYEMLTGKPPFDAESMIT